MEQIVSNEYAEKHTNEELFETVQDAIKEALPCLDLMDSNSPDWIIAYLLGDIAQSLRSINANIFDYTLHN